MGGTLVVESACRRQLRKFREPPPRPRSDTNPVRIIARRSKCRLVIALSGPSAEGPAGAARPRGPHEHVDIMCWRRPYTSAGHRPSTHVVDPASEQADTRARRKSYTGRRESRAGH